MSMHKKPLTELEREGLIAHGLDIGTPSQLSDVFRQGIAFALANAPTVQREGWVSVEDRLPENDKQVMAWVVDKDNKYGGYRELVNYGSFSFVDLNNVCPDADEDGEVNRFGWHYGRESEGEYDYLVFDLNDKVTHWTTVLDMPAAPTDKE